MTTKQKDYFTTREAADQLGVAVSTIQLWVNSGLLRAWKTAGGHRRIAKDSVEEMINAQRDKAGVEKHDGQISIVIVEDDEQQLRLYEKQLETRGINAHIVKAKNGCEGLIKTGLTLPEIIITDLMMPDMDGFQMIKSLEKLPELQHCQIVVVTGLTQQEIRERGGLPEEVVLLSKPLAFEKLEALIRKKSNRDVALT